MIAEEHTKLNCCLCIDMLICTLKQQKFNTKNERIVATFDSRLLPLPSQFFYFRLDTTKNTVSLAPPLPVRESMPFLILPILLLLGAYFHLTAIMKWGLPFSVVYPLVIHY